MPLDAQLIVALFGDSCTGLPPAPQPLCLGFAEFAVPRASGHAGWMHKTAGLRDPAAAFPLPSMRDDVQERREANRAIVVSAIGLAATGILELLLAVDRPANPPPGPSTRACEHKRRGAL